MGVNSQAVKSRRKNGTYGKSSHKVLSGVQRPTINFLSTSEDDETYQQSSSQVRKHTSTSTILDTKRDAGESQKHSVLNKRSANTTSTDEVSHVDDCFSDTPESRSSQKGTLAVSSAKRSFLSAGRPPTEKRRRLHREDKDYDESVLDKIDRRRKLPVEARGAGLVHEHDSHYQRQRGGSRGQSQSAASGAIAKPGAVKPSDKNASNTGISCENGQDSSTKSRVKPEITPSAASGSQSPTTQYSYLDNACTESLKPKSTPPRNILRDALPRFSSPSSLQMPDLTISTIRRQRSKTPTKKPINDYNLGPTIAFSPSRQKLRDKLIHNSTYSSSLSGHDFGDTKVLSPPLVEIDEDLVENVKLEADKTYTADAKNGSGNVGSATITQNRGPKVTYAAEHRTLLQESTDTIFDSCMLADGTSFVTAKRSRELPATIKPERAPSDEQELEKPSQNTMRSIHELREAGVNQRLTRQTEALLDDVENCVHQSQRRLALIEVVKGLQSPSFVRQFLEAGCGIRLLNVAKSSSDEIVSFLLSTIFLITANEPDSYTMLEEQFQGKTVNYLSQCLSYNECMEGPSLSRRFGISRDFQKQIRTICEYIRRLPVWGATRPQKMTCQVVSLQCLERIVRSSREGGSLQEMLSKEAIERLVDIIYHADVGPNEAVTQAHGVTVVLALSILESSAVVYSITGLDCSLLWTDRMVTRLCDFILKVPRNTAKDWQLLSLFLRLGLNLSNNSLQICKLFSRTDTLRTILQISADNFLLLSADGRTDDQNVLMDNLILSLGLLINLCDDYPKTCKLFLEPAADGGTSLETVIRLFLTRIPSAFEVNPLRT